MIKHKHEREIIAWAKGAEIEFREAIAPIWHLKSQPIWSYEGKYRVNPWCRYALDKLIASVDAGTVDLYLDWLNGEEVTAEHPVCKSNLLKASDHEDPFHYFLECAKGHKLSKKVVKVKQWLWIKVEDDKLVDNSYINEGISLDAMRDIRSAGWIKTEHFVEVEK